MKNIIKWIRRKKLKEMDENWHINGDSCWILYLPSFYATHTWNEIEDIEKSNYVELKVSIDKLDQLTTKK